MIQSKKTIKVQVPSKVTSSRWKSTIKKQYKKHRKNFDMGNSTNSLAWQRKTRLSPETNFLFFRRRKSFSLRPWKRYPLLWGKFLNIYARCSGSQQVEIASLSRGRGSFPGKFPRGVSAPNRKKDARRESLSFKSHYENKASYNKLLISIKSLFFV